MLRLQRLSSLYGPSKAETNTFSPKISIYFSRKAEFCYIFAKIKNRFERWSNDTFPTCVEWSHQRNINYTSCKREKWRHQQHIVTSHFDHEEWRYYTDEREVSSSPDDTFIWGIHGWAEGTVPVSRELWHVGERTVHPEPAK